MIGWIIVAIVFAVGITILSFAVGAWVMFKILTGSW